MKNIFEDRRNYLAMSATIFVLLSFCLSALGRYVCINIAEEYLGIAKKESSQEAIIRDLEMATLLYPSESNRLATANQLITFGDQGLAVRYLVDLPGKDAEKALAKAYYSNGDFEKTLKLTQKLLENDQEVVLLQLQTFLSLGRLTDAQSFVATNAYRQDKEIKSLAELITLSPQVSVLRQCNGLNNAGFPQSASLLLSQGQEASLLDRDGLLALAQAQNNEGRAELAYQSLVQALVKDPFYPQTFRQLIVLGEKLHKDSEALEYKNSLDKLVW